MPDDAASRLGESLRLDLCLKTALTFMVGRGNPLPELITLLGYEKAMEFILVFGGQHFDVPLAADVVRPLNVAGAARAVLDGKLTKAKAARTFDVQLTEVHRCVDLMRAEQAEVRQNSRIAAELVEELNAQKEEQERSIGEA